MNTNWNDSYKNMWDERYKEQGHAYGTEPNLFFKEWIQKFEPANILMPADGEGRNGVFAAELGWNVTCFDLSIEGKAKAIKLANDKNVTLDYFVGDLEQLEFKEEMFDAIGLIYAHFASDKKSEYHKRLIELLKPGGIVILEAFSKKHIALNRLNPDVGGPKDIEMLFSISEMNADFENFKILELKEEEIHLDEGKYHKGIGSVVRFVGRKYI